MNSEIRHLTRSKLWSSFRMSGLQGPQAQDTSAANDEAGLSYPGNGIRRGEYLGYWYGWDFPDVVGGGGAGRVDPNATRNMNSHGEGTFILAKTGSTKRISYSGPRTTSTDVVTMVYDAAMAPEFDLGVDDGKSTYWPGAPLPDPPESPDRDS